MSHYEIFILNYKGERFLDDCLTSLLNLESSEHVVGINVIDNGSNDNSEALVKKYQNVNYIPLGHNLGFSAGNNRGVELRLKQLANKPDYVMFLNNDTTVDSQLIKSIDRTFITQPEAGVVGVRSLFMDDYIPVSFDFNRESIDVVIQGQNIGQDYRRYRTFKGEYLGDDLWRIKKSGCIFVPVNESADYYSIRLASCSSESVKLTVLNDFYRDGNNFIKVDSDYKVFSLNEKVEVPKNRIVKLIQNAGSFVTKRFEAGDLGSFEIDRGQYSRDRELSAVCGVAMTIKTDLYLELGGFDEHFFAYYEDTDLSLRAKRRGYKCFYSGAAIINHIHAASSGLGSNYFNFNVAYSKLYFVSKFAPRNVFKKLLSELKFTSGHEFEVYLRDGAIENKPNLRSYTKYIKYYLKFLFNRATRLINQKKDSELFKNFIEEKYVNEY